jgi:hypothetical protein
VRRVLLIAATTGYQIRSFGEAAASLGITLSIASDRCDRLEDPWWDQAIPVRFHDEPAAVAAVTSAVSGQPPAAVIAVGDRPTILAAEVNAALGLPGNPPAAARASRHKLQARRLLREAGLPVPRFAAASLDDDAAALGASVAYPVVIKPLALSGSRGVMRADDPDEFAARVARLRALLQAGDIRGERDPAHDGFLVESFVPGAEFAIEGVLTRGSFHALAIFDKPDPLDGPFFEETIYLTPSRQAPAVRERIVETVAAAARALGLRHGPVHAECRVNETGVYVLEVAARPIGGLCARALRFTGPSGGVGAADATVPLEALLLRHAIGEDVTAYRREARASGVMMLPIPRRGVLRRVEGIDAARAVSGVDDVRITAKPDALLVPLPEGRSYLGFVFAHGGTPGEVEASLRDASGQLRFVIDKDVPLASP